MSPEGRLGHRWTTPDRWPHRNIWLWDSAFHAEVLADFAIRLGRHADARTWRSIHDRLCSLMNERLWSETAGVYMDADAGTDRHTGVLSFAGLTPLVCGAASAAQAEAIVRHLRTAPRTRRTCGADRIATLTCETIERAYERHGCIFEYYDDEGRCEPPALHRKGSCNPDRWIHQVIHDYGWSATLYLDWVLR